MQRFTKIRFGQSTGSGMVYIDWYPGDGVGFSALI
jgi:hypothetical protein